MTTTLHKPKKRKTHERRYERGKSRAIVVTLLSGGLYGLASCTRREETLPIEVAWERAVKMRLAAEATDRLKKKAAKAGVPYAQYVRRRRTTLEPAGLFLSKIQDHSRGSVRFNRMGLMRRRCAHRGNI
jgi:hypothetical protein